MKRLLDPRLALFLLFPALGFTVLALAFLNGGPQTEESTPPPFDLADLPTPAPISAPPTARPTVTFAPVLDAPPPAAPLVDRMGVTFTLQDLGGQIVVVNFWATWCPPCVREMPVLEQFARDNPEVMVLAVTNPTDGQTLEGVQAFVKEHDLRALRVVYDEANTLKNLMRVANLPMTYVLDRENVVRFRQIGEVTRADLDYYLAELN